MLDGSNDVDKDVPSLALIDVAAHLRSKIAPKPQFYGHE